MFSLVAYTYSSPPPLLTHNPPCVLSQVVPSALGPRARDLLAAFEQDWHITHYDMQADLDTRDAYASVKHLEFLFGVRAWDLGKWL